MDGYRLVTRPEEMDTGAIHDWLAGSYWAKGVSRDVVERSLRHSLCFALLHGHELAAFCRVVTDRATFAYLADVFVIEAHRGRGLGKRVVAEALAHPDLVGLRRFVLATRDAHGLYARFGFAPLGGAERWMEKRPAPRP